MKTFWSRSGKCLFGIMGVTLVFGLVCAISIRGEIPMKINYQQTNGSTLSLLPFPWTPSWSPSGFILGYTSSVVPYGQITNTYTSLCGGGYWRILEWNTAPNEPGAVLCPGDEVNCQECLGVRICDNTSHNCNGNCSGECCLENAQQSVRVAKKLLNGIPCIELAQDNSKRGDVCLHYNCQRPAYCLFIDPTAPNSCIPPGDNYASPCLNDMVSLTPEVLMYLSYVGAGASCPQLPDCDPPVKYADLKFGLYFCNSSECFYSEIFCYKSRGMDEACSWFPDLSLRATSCPITNFNNYESLTPGGPARYYAPDILSNIKWVIQNGPFNFSDKNLCNWHFANYYIGWESMGRMFFDAFISDIDLTCQVTDEWRNHDDDGDGMSNGWELDHGSNPFRPETPTPTPTNTPTRTKTPTPTITPTPTPVNRIPNPGFEDDPPDYWNKNLDELDSPSKIFLHSTELHHDTGFASCKFLDPTADYSARAIRSNYGTDYVPVTPGYQYKASCYYYLRQDTPGSIATETHFRFRMEWWNNAGNFISWYPGGNTGITCAAFGPPWIQVSYHNVVAPAGAAYMTLRAECREDQNWNNDLFVDDFFADREY